ncbi:DNA methyltransferase [Mesorhizobium sp. B1-1-7]|uniref:DNA methyltransferase n=1 Tax=Mesorhizobium sp. B1-1-7 TaxID=2589977 RepID=UPI00112D91C6|nr:DNA methyltransferase [Mesorhizobium sp. B1-1-7]TPN43225.1 DNA methylase N-4 [Mesorhizobium sp. B1-1-7]
MNAPLAHSVDDPYLDFLRRKMQLAKADGFDVALDDINQAGAPHCRAIVRWALKGGSRAIFASFGLHKTFMQIELMRLVGRFAPGLRLIVIPLGVRHEFFAEAEERFAGTCAVKLKFIRSDAEIVGDDTIYLTNYESVLAGKIDVTHFVAASLDEAAVLRGYGTKTFQTFLPLFKAVRFKFVATATPSPNRTKELIHYAGFLGVMDTGQALTRFFQRNSESAGDLTLFPHKEDEFWLWVHSWAVFLQSPSDLGFSDEGYVLPKVAVNWHEVEIDHSTAGYDRDGQGLLIRNTALGVTQASAAKRDSLAARIERMGKLLAQDPEAHCILWHDLEDERRAIEAMVPGVRSIYGTQGLEANETNAIGFKDGKFKYLATKPEMSGAGNNFQKHCHWAVFVGVGFKFHDFIQAVHRIVRFGQRHECRIDIIFSEAEREVRRNLEGKWAEHERLMARMAEIIRRYGLDGLPLDDVLQRSIGVARREERGDSFVVAHNDAVLEARMTQSASVGEIITSVPFANHYEYTASYNDFGHTDDNGHFWAQMHFLTPELFRILKPGRLACIHVKDRVLFGSVTGEGVPTVSPFHAEAIFHYLQHGFQYCGMITVVTDVVKENNQTYRLTYSEMMKDATKMGVGCPEYVLLFRRPQSDLSRGYADEPVVHDKPLVYAAGTKRRGQTQDDRSDDLTMRWSDGDRRAQVPGSGYTLARWQLDAHAFWPSSGDRLLTTGELVRLGPKPLRALFQKQFEGAIYDFEKHVQLGEELAARDALSKTYMTLDPPSADPGVWTDVVRMRTLNGEQAFRNLEKHVCPLQFDIVDRLIDRYSNPGDIVYDPFGGLMTVPYRAILKGRRGQASELSDTYFRDGVRYCREAEAKRAIPTMFDMLGIPEIEESKPAALPESFFDGWEEDGEDGDQVEAAE